MKCELCTRRVVCVDRLCGPCWRDLALHTITRVLGTSLEFALRAHRERIERETSNI